MRRTALIAAVLLGAFALAACQSRGVGQPTPSKCTPQPDCGVAATTYPITPAYRLTGIAAHGKVIFKAKNCGGCHTLADANTNGTVGPNLDEAQPDYRHATAQITNGGGGMPPFESDLTAQQIADVAQYVVTSTGGAP